MIPYHPVHQNVRRDALKRTPESDSLSYIVNIENDQNHNEKHLFTENNFYCPFILEKWPPLVHQIWDMMKIAIFVRQ